MTILNPNIEILYEDKSIIAANKPEGLASISENDVAIETLHSILERKYSQKLFIVHRLDKEVSGVIIYVRNSLIHKYLNQQFSERKVLKSYIALVHGIIKENTGLIDKPIKEFGSGRMGVDKKGKPSSTAIKVLHRYENFTLIELNPTTGRRHQLRVHLYAVGHPIVGDVRYGDKKQQMQFPRLMLHAKSIGFKLSHDKKVFIEAPLQVSFITALKEIPNVNNK